MPAATGVLGFLVAFGRLAASRCATVVAGVVLPRVN